MLSEGKKDFFISHNKADKQWAKWIAAVLEGTKKNDNEKYSCIVQPWDFRPGGNFVLYMDDALKNSERFIAVLSSGYLKSLYCQAEWAAAFTKDPNSVRRTLIPVRVSDIKPEGLLAAIIYIDLFGVDDENEAEKRLINGVDIGDIPRNRPSFPGSSKIRYPGCMPFHNLPFSRNSYFTGRDDILSSICIGFESGNSISLTQTVSGLGGLGKTQTALEYAYRYALKYEWIWWVSAESESAVAYSYKDFATKMKLIDSDNSDDEVVIEAVLTWMDTHDGWLFIYDNMESVPRDVPWWPKNNRGNILITTRNKISQAGKRLDISTFTEDEAVEFLLKRTDKANDKKSASELAGRLGYLSLALEQAAAYMVNNENTSFEDYLKLIEEYGLTVLEEVEGVIDYKIPVTATWEISFRKIRLEESRQLLYLCAYLAPEEIYTRFFSENAELLPMPLQEKIVRQIDVNATLRELTSYSLLVYQDDKKSYAMHRLLQEVIRDKLSEEPQ